MNTTNQKLFVHEQCNNYLVSVGRVSIFVLISLLNLNTFLFSPLFRTCPYCLMNWDIFDSYLCRCVIPSFEKSCCVSIYANVDYSVISKILLCRREKDVLKGILKCILEKVKRLKLRHILLPVLFILATKALSLMMDKAVRGGYATGYTAGNTNCS